MNVPKPPLRNDVTPSRNIVFYDRMIPAGSCVSLHWHDFLEFEIILSGEAEHIYNNTTYTATPGSAYMMSYYDFHGITAVTDLHLYSIHFDKTLIDPQLFPYLEFNKLRCQFNAEQTSYIAQLMLQLQKESNEQRYFRNMILKSILSQLLVTLIRETSAANEHTVPIPLQNAIAYINSHFCEQLTLKQLADHLSFSPNYLGQLFKAQIGTSFHEYLNTLRLKYACTLLSTSNMSVKEVSFAAGYQSVQYFLYVFKEKLGMTPGEFRIQDSASQRPDIERLKYQSGADQTGLYLPLL